MTSTETATRPPGPATARRAAPWPEVGVAVVATLLFTWRIGAPSPWRDEAVTEVVTQRSLSDILQLTGHVDRVHLLYYLLVHAAQVVHPGIVTARLLSAAALVVTAVLLVRLGRRLDSATLGSLAALVLLASPLVSRYAQEARPYPLVIMTVTAATLLLVRAFAPSGTRRDRIFYVVLLLATAALNVLGLVVVAAHGAFVAARHRPALRSWTAAVVVTGALASPWVWLTQQQAGQVGWLRPPAAAQLWKLFDAALDPTAVVVVVILAGVMAGALEVGARRTSPAVVLGLLWTFLPPVLLWTLSQVHPLFSWRYVVYSLPGPALLVAACLVQLGARLPRTAARMGAAGVLLALAVGGLHMQGLYRDDAVGHAEDLRGVATYLSSQARPGDAVLFVPADFRIIALTYPADFAAVEDVALGRDARSEGTLTGSDTSDAVLRQRLATVDRVWVVTGAHGLQDARGRADATKAAVLAAEFSPGAPRSCTPFQVRLYQRSR